MPSVPGTPSPFGHAGEGDDNTEFIPDTGPFVARGEANLAESKMVITFHGG
jgi:hypothetical protein